MAGPGKLLRVFQQKPWLLTLGLAGLLVVVVGLAVVGISWQGNQAELQIIEASSAPAAVSVLVDVGGAVIKPGIYEFNPDSRFNDALVAAGGFTQEADRDWVSQNLNLAAKLKDGEKIYIPWRGENVSEKVGPLRSEGPTLTGRININTASLAELETLWGIGPGTAQKIIDSRPYGKIDNLLDKKIVKTNVYEA